MNFTQQMLDSHPQDFGSADLDALAACRACEEVATPSLVPAIELRTSRLKAAEIFLGGMVLAPGDHHERCFEHLARRIDGVPVAGAERPLGPTW